MPITYPIQCFSCGAKGSVNRVTAGLQCRCGSTDLDLWDGIPVVANRAAADDPDRYSRERSESYGGYDNGGATEDDREDDDDDGWRDHKHAASPGTGWNQKRPDPAANWNVYEGPGVGHNPLKVDDIVNDNHICPACNGSGRDSRASGGGYDENGCRTCNGTGIYNPPTSKPNGVENNDAHTNGPPSGGARWQASKSATRAKVTMPDGTTYFLPVSLKPTVAGRKSSDPMGSSEDYIQNGGGYGAGERGNTLTPDHTTRGLDFDKPLQLDNTRCPSCGHGPTHLTKDKNDDAWWNCSNCGSLANVDKHPEVDPYGPGKGFVPDRGMKRKGKILHRSGESTGRLFAMTAAIQSKNAVSIQEAITLARQALIRFPEGRV